MELQTFPTEKEKPRMIDKLLKLAGVILIMIMLLFVIDIAGILVQAYAMEYGEEPRSWVVQPIETQLKEVVSAQVSHSNNRH